MDTRSDLDLAPGWTAPLEPAAPFRPELIVAWMPHCVRDAVAGLQI